MPQSFEHITGVYAYVANAWYRFLADVGDLPELLNKTTPLNIPPITERVAIEINQPSYNYDESPHFLWKELLYTHMNHVWRHDPYASRGDPTAIHVYPLAFEEAAKRMLYLVDVAIERNPNTVIVLQADHGFHRYRTQLYLLDQGYNMEQVLELIHSVFSAIRIPPKYGGLDTPIAPLNISRELINRFVGENYTLLP